MNRPIVNLADLELVPLAAMSADAGDTPPPGRFGGAMARIAPLVGAKKLGYNLTVIPPGVCAFPFHSHRVNEEMFFILEGEGEVRIGDARHAIRGGDVIACPPGGAETAHQIANTSTQAELRILAVSTRIYPEICEYPDSGKFAVADPHEDDAHAFRYVGRAASAVGYWDGE
jgi:uncharacterized cupin superfamily protein